MLPLDRRLFLKSTGLGLTGFALPSIALSADNPRRPIAPPSGKIPDASLMTDVCAFIQKSASTPLPPAVVQKAKHHILDTFAAMISGADFKVGQLSRAFAKAQGGAEQSSVFGEKFLTNATNAALANGNMAHADETDDSHEPSGTHPGCAVIPAALAIAEKENISGLAFLQAVVVGYDFCGRATPALGGVDSRGGIFASHSIGGIFGAAAAGASAMKLNPQQIRYVMDYTGQQAAGMLYYAKDLEHVEKAFVFAGMPAHDGALAAMMVQAGFTGVNDVFSGELSLFRAYSDTPAPERLSEKLGEHFVIMATNIKKFSVGSPVQASLEALSILINRYHFNPAEVAKFETRLPEFNAESPVNNRAMPDLNLQHCLAVMMLDGDLTFKSAHDFARMKDPAVLEMRKRLSVISDESLRRPETGRVARVTVTMKDSTNYSELVNAVPGTAQNPMTTAQVEAKARDILLPYLGATRTTALIEAVARIDEWKSIRELRALLA